MNSKTQSDNCAPVVKEVGVVRNITTVLPLVCTYCEQDGRGAAPQPYFIIHDLRFGMHCIHCGEEYGTRPATVAEWEARRSRARWNDAYWAAVDREYPKVYYYVSPDEVTYKGESL